jgi:acyl-coenzyme A thioesterase PaaI-like protein
MQTQFDVKQANAVLADNFAPWVKALNLRVVSVDGPSATLILPFSEALVRVGGTVCGQALMSAADTAMVIAISSALGGFKPMATVSLNTSFMRPIANADIELKAQVLKPGKTLMFGDIQWRAVAKPGEPAAPLAGHATTTYALAA